MKKPRARARVHEDTHRFLVPLLLTFLLPFLLPLQGMAQGRAGIDKAYQDLYRAAKQKPGMTAAEFDAKRKEIVVPEAQRAAKERDRWLELVLDKNGIKRYKSEPPVEPNDAGDDDQPDSPEVSEEEAETFPLFGDKTSGAPAKSKTGKGTGTANPKKPEPSRPARSRPAAPEIQLDGNGVTILDFSK